MVTTDPKLAALYAENGAYVVDVGAGCVWRAIHADRPDGSRVYYVLTSVDEHYAPFASTHARQEFSGGEWKDAPGVPVRVSVLYFSADLRSDYRHIRTPEGLLVEAVQAGEEVEEDTYREFPSVRAGLAWIRSCVASSAPKPFG